MKSIAMRFLLPFGMVAVVFSTLVFYETHSTTQHYTDDLIRQQAAMTMQFNLAIRAYVAETSRPAAEKILGHDAFVPELMSATFVSRSIFERVQQQFPGYLLRFTSDHPRNPANQSTPAEQQMIDFFRHNPKVIERTEQIQIDGRRYVAQFKPRWVKLECLRCHGDPKDAPAALIQRYGATAGFHRQVGDVAGLDMVAIPEESVATALAAETKWKSLVLAVWLAFLFGLIIIVFHFVVTRRLTAMARHFREISTQAKISHMTPVEVEGRDEIDVLKVAFNRLFEQLRVMHVSLETRVTERTADLARANDGLKQEVGERQRAEEALRKSEQRLRAIINRAPFGAYFFELKPDGLLVLTGANPAADKILRVANQTFLNKSIEEAFPELKSTEIPGAFRRVAASGEEYQNDEVEYHGQGISGVFEVHAFQTGANRMAVFFQDVTERKRGQDAIRASLEEKTVLLKEVHHRVKNNLQIVISLLNLQAVRTKNPMALDTLQETGNRVRSMALLHETLYRSESLGRVNFANYIESICDHLFRSYGPKAARVRLEPHLEEVSIDLDQAVSCGLIINELVSNALKHAFPEGRAGRITVELHKLPQEQAVLTVADDGVGMPPQLNVRQTGTLGHQLVFMLVEKLRGTVEVTRDHGTAFRIVFHTRHGEERA
jgi:two-component sensor histidine kinase/PAS domain-containing protein